MEVKVCCNQGEEILSILNRINEDYRRAIDGLEFTNTSQD